MVMVVTTFACLLISMPFAAVIFAVIFVEVYAVDVFAHHVISMPFAAVLFAVILIEVFTVFACIVAVAVIFMPFTAVFFTVIFIQIFAVDVLAHHLSIRRHAARQELEASCCRRRRDSSINGDGACFVANGLRHVNMV